MDGAGACNITSSGLDLNSVSLRYDKQQWEDQKWRTSAWDTLIQLMYPSWWIRTHLLLCSSGVEYFLVVKTFLWCCKTKDVSDGVFEAFLLLHISQYCSWISYSDLPNWRHNIWLCGCFGCYKKWQPQSVNHCFWVNLSFKFFSLMLHPPWQSAVNSSPSLCAPCRHHSPCSSPARCLHLESWWTDLTR